MTDDWNLKGKEVIMRIGSEAKLVVDGAPTVVEPAFMEVFPVTEINTLRKKLIEMVKLHVGIMEQYPVTWEINKLFGVDE